MKRSVKEASWHCVVAALHQVDIWDAGGFIGCSATGRDPQLKISPQSAEGLDFVLPPGFYEIVFTATLESGTLINPCLYLDFGDGFSEAAGHKVLLGKLAQDQWAGRFSAPRSIHNMRLDPSEEMLVLSKVGVTIAERPKAGSGRTAFNTARAVYRALPRSMRQALIERRVAHWFHDRLSNDTDAGPLGSLTAEHAATDPVSYVDQGAQQWAGGLVADYTSRMFIAKGGRVGDYAAIASEPVPRHANGVKAIAYYLPQMHPIPENDKWWGRGFTEWTNVSKAVAQFDGHYQPRLPAELGFYDLRVPEVMARQIELAKLYGLHGFCFYYYWFHGKRLLERPLDMFLERKSPDFDMDFCLCWANENWTRRWDGAESEVLMGQEHSPQDHANVFADLVRYLEDPRYIRVDGKPLILIYRPAIIPDVAEMLRIWRAAAEKRGMKGLYIVSTNSFGYDKPEADGFDALCGFPPHGVEAPAVNQLFPLINSDYKGYIFRYADVVEGEVQKLKDLAQASSKKQSATARFPGVMVAWDNEARKPGRGNVFHGSTPELYRQWLEQATAYSSACNKEDRQFVFINAWNEWAEGAYLEPDRKFGYAYLAATANVLNECHRQSVRLAEICAQHNAAKSKTSDIAICAHLFYPDMIAEFAETFRHANEQRAMDVILTVPDTWTEDNLRRAIDEISPTRVIAVCNRGRDVAPFLEALRTGLDMGYRIGCKVHSKRSPQRTDGDAWRRRLFKGLLGTEAIEEVVGCFIPDEEAGLAAPASEFVLASDLFTIRDNLALSASIMSHLDQPNFILDEFVAGTMFWFRFEALRPIAESQYGAEDFNIEMGQIDGTLAHAFERIFVPFVKARGMDVVRYKLATKPDIQETE